MAAVSNSASSPDISALAQQLTQALQLIEDLEEQFEAALGLNSQNSDKPQQSPGSSSPSRAGGSGGIGGGSSGSKKAGAHAGPKGFLWKPEADPHSRSPGKLVVLIPPNLTNSAASVKVLSPDGSRVLGQGKESGVPPAGGRRIFRFDKTGSAYPPGSILEITLKNGQKQRIVIEKPGVRTEGK